MEYAFFALTIIALFIGGILYNSRKSKKKKLEKLKNSWGQVKMEDRRFEFIELYNKLNKDYDFYQLSEQTIGDIDFYELFSFVDRTTSKIGQQFLFDMLTKPTKNIQILEEIDKQADFFLKNKDVREDVQKSLIELNDVDSYYITTLLQENVFVNPQWTKWLYLDSLIVVILLLLSPVYPFLLLWLLVPFTINLMIHFWNKNNTFSFFKSFPQLNLLIDTTDILTSRPIPFVKENAEKSSRALKKFQNNYKVLNFGQVSGDEITQVLLLLTELIKALFLLEVHTFFKLIRFLKTKQNDIKQVFEYVGSIDMAISIASLRDGAVKTCTPEFICSPKNILFSEAFHPLIEKSVGNSIATNSKSILITGSNMSGKTTFLRTIAINAILAQSIYTCFAEKYVAPFVRVYSSIRADDNLINGESYYLNEVQTVKSIIVESNLNHQNLFLLDEVFKGTNTIERISSAKAILSYLNRNENLVFVSTHDIELATLLEKEYDMYHFSETFIENQLVFDYILKPGVLKNRNAIRILELSGYPKEIIEEANNLSRQMTFLNPFTEQ